MAANDFALTVDADLGREIPRRLRLLMLPTNEFFAISSPIAFSQPCRDHPTMNYSVRRTICGAGCPCPLWEP